jgi:hypothetical protein
MSPNAAARFRRRLVPARLGLLLLVPAVWTAGTAGPLRAQASLPDAGTRAAAADAEVARLSRALARDRRAHLRRVGSWGGLNVLGGTALALASDDGSTGRAFGVQSAGWGAVNVGLAAWGLLRDEPPPAEGLDAALEDEDGWAHLLLVNLGLNVGYAAVGGTLLLAAERGLEGAEAARGHGGALILQGAGLFLLDWLAWRSSGGRLDALRAKVGPGGAAAAPAPSGAPVRLTLLSIQVP